MIAAIELADVAGILCVAGVAALVYGQRSLHGRLQRVEQKLDVSLRQLGIDWDDLPRREFSPQVRALAEAGERQLAVELQQRESGLTFDDAQVAVEAYMRGELPEGTLPVERDVRRSA